MIVYAITIICVLEYRFNQTRQTNTSNKLLLRHSLDWVKQSQVDSVSLFRHNSTLSTVYSVQSYKWFYYSGDYVLTSYRPLIVSSSVLLYDWLTEPMWPLAWIIGFQIKLYNMSALHVLFPLPRSGIYKLSLRSSSILIDHAWSVANFSGPYLASWLNPADFCNIQTHRWLPHIATLD